MFRKTERLLFFFVLALAAFFSLTCQKPVQYETPQVYGDVGLTVRDTMLDTVNAGGKVFYNQPAFHITVQDIPGRDPANTAPVIFNIYKFYPATGTRNPVLKIFGGGEGYTAPGTTVYYRNGNGSKDLLIYRSGLDTVFIVGAEDKNKYYLEVAPLSGLTVESANVFSGGLEGKRVSDGLERGGGHSRRLEINGNDPYTADNRVTVKATFSTAGISEIFYLRYSSQITELPFDQIVAMDSALKSATASDGQSVGLSGGNRLRLADSLVFDQAGINIGKFGGLYKTRTDAASLTKAFGSVIRDTVSTGFGETGWVTIEKKDTLPTGPGQKKIWLYNPTWSLPLSDVIDIRPYNMEILLDEAHAKIRRNNVENKVCLLSDDIPFTVNTFGDTSFDDKVWVWIATLNLSPSPLISDPVSKTTKFYNHRIDNNTSAFKIAFSWPEALLETPPESFQLQSDGRAEGVLNRNADPNYYESNYRVSPLNYLGFGPSENDPSGQQTSNIAISISADNIRRSNSSSLSQLMSKGSILGYSESRLGNFNGQDYVLNIDDKGAWKWVLYPGWFEVPPLASVAPNAMYSPGNLLSYFGCKYGIGQTDIDSGFSARPQSKFYSVYAAYCYAPDPTWGSSDIKIYDQLKNSGVKLYKNPMRTIPYFLVNNMKGSKEFLLCVYTRGKHFKEPRATLSFFSTSTRYVWDKIPPHFMWDTTTSVLSSTYAPLYYSYSSPGNNQLQTKITDLGATTIPYVFDVWLSPKRAFGNLDCSLRDVGFGKITSARLCFNYSSDILAINPVSGYRTYSRNSIKIDLDARTFANQAFAQYNSNTGGSYAIQDVVFKNVDARSWQGGLWDMWLETEDDLQNKGISPLVVSGTPAYDQGAGSVIVRQIKVH